MTTPSSDLSRTAGLVLAGGQSSRFGADKALAHFHGERLLDRARRPLQRLPAVAISAKPGSAVAAYALDHAAPVLADDPQGPDGPLAGILAGLEWAQTLEFSFLASVPCDAPVLPLNLVEALLAGRGEAKAAFAQTASGVHPLCAVWSTSVIASLRPILAHRRHPSVRSFLADIGAVAVDFARADEFINTNTRDILHDLERRL